MKPSTIISPFFVILPLFSHCVFGLNIPESALVPRKDTGNNNGGNGGKNNNRNGNSGKGGSDPQTSLTLDPKVIAKGFANDGQDVPAAGQVASLTSTNNFINFCLTVPNLPITNGKQIPGGSCNPAPIGTIPSTDSMPSSKFTNPKNGDTIAANKAFTISMAIKNLETGNFVNADSNYFAAPQQLSDQGKIIGHSHVVVEALSALDQTKPTDPQKFAFFKGLNGVAEGGTLTADVTDGLPAGAYRLCSINSAANHQPAIVPIAQHGSLDDCVYFTASDGGAATGGKGGSGKGNGKGGNGNGKGSNVATDDADTDAGADTDADSDADNNTDNDNGDNTSVATATATGSGKGNKGSTTAAAGKATQTNKGNGSNKGNNGDGNVGAGKAANDGTDNGSDETDSSDDDENDATNGSANGKGKNSQGAGNNASVGGAAGNRGSMKNDRRRFSRDH